MAAETRAGTVVGHFGIEVEVALPDGERMRARVRKGTPVVVGDEVEVEPAGAVPAARRTVLARRDARERVRPIAANLDAVGIAVAARPPAPPSYLDRALVAARAAGIEPFVVVNKCDLPESQSLFEALAADPALAESDIPVFAVSAQEERGLEAVGAHLLGRRGAFIGTSGVGKSSLLNALVPGLALATGEINRFTRLGRHVTTHATLHVLPGGGELIDTPGFRDFVPVDVSPEDLARHFPGFQAALEVGCRFANCVHRDEPDCAVTAACREGEISEERYAAYRELLADLERIRDTGRARGR